MTIATTASKVVAQGNGVTTAFSYSFLIPAAANAKVTYTDANGNQSVLSTSQYSISGLGSANGGAVTYPLSGSPIASGTSLTIERVLPYQQLTSLVNQGGYYPAVVEGALDSLEMQIQQLAAYDGSAIKFPPVDPPTLTAVLPAAAARANTLLGFDASGNVTTVVPAAQSASALALQLLTSIGTTLLGYTLGAVGAVVRTLQSRLRGQVLASDFGLSLSNTGAQNLAAMQAAIDTGRNVLVEDPPTVGVLYPMTGTLAVNTTGQTIDFQSQNAGFAWTADADGFQLNASFIEIKRAKLAGAAADTTSTSSGLKFVNTTRSKISLCYVTGFAYGANGENATRNWVNMFDHSYLFGNKRASSYAMGHGTVFVGGELSASPYLILQAKVKAGATFAIDRDFTGDLGSGITTHGTTLESAYQSAAIATTANNGAGLVRVHTSVPHNCTTGDPVSVSSVVTGTEANGVWPAIVIDPNTLDLKGSTWAANGTGGTLKRGAALYCGPNTTGARINGGDIEDCPIVAVFGEAYKNDGTTAHTGPCNGGTVQDVSFSADSQAPTESALVYIGYATGVRVEGNVGYGTSTTLINTRAAVNPGVINKAANYNFTRDYQSGSVAMTGLQMKPVDGNGGSVQEWYVPSTLGSTVLSLAAQVANALDGVWNWYFPNNIRLGKSLLLGQSGTAPTTTTGGTIATGVGASRVAPAGNITGVILQAGAFAGQLVTVINESAFSITFAAAGTSNVADGTSTVIAANRCGVFVWDDQATRWFRS